jgi:hypothetical protein
MSRSLCNIVLDSLHISNEDVPRHRVCSEIISRVSNEKRDRD